MIVSFYITNTVQMRADRSRMLLSLLQTLTPDALEAQLSLLTSPCFVLALGDAEAEDEAVLPLPLTCYRSEEPSSWFDSLSAWVPGEGRQEML